MQKYHHGLYVPTPDHVNQKFDINVDGDAEFVAGFLFGMVGDNHLDEIKKCYKGI